ncbi:ABC transporter permease [Bacillus sp. DNRA2]|nr:ABC transporter permease [Bacillus sp. DNRA2]
MTLFQLAMKNIKGNFSNYLVYFTSLVFSIVIYYTFVSLQYSEKIQDSILISDSMKFMFMASSFVLILFVALFILYSNSFFMRKRKREVGLYSMLGLRKKTIGQMLFFENVMMGLIALVIGILLGTLLSKLFAMILVKLMGASAEVDFGISLMAIGQTVLVFMILILFTSIQGYRMIYRYKLIELFQAEKKGEDAPKSSVLSTVVGLILLGVSYWLILRPFPEELSETYIFTNYGIALLMLVVGTDLFFRFVTVFLLKWSQKNKHRYYRGTNLIETTQLLHRIKGNARTFSMIALMSGATISFFGATYSGYYSNEQSTKDVVPFSYSHLSKGEEFDQKVEQVIASDKEHPIIAQLDIAVINVEGKLDFKLDYETGAGPFQVISETTMNQVMEALDRDGEDISLSGNEAAAIKPRFTKFTAADFAGKNFVLRLPDRNEQYTFVTMLDGSILPFAYPDFVVVVSDERFVELSEGMRPLNYKVYEVKGENSAAETSAAVNELVGKDFQTYSAYYSEYKEGMEGNALMLFILGFLGLVFLGATGSIIYFKQLTEATESKQDYAILRKIGVNTKGIRHTINKQMLFVFGLPLTVGILHGCVILKFTSNFISDLIGISLVVPIVSAMAAFVMIYLGYYLMTVNTYNRIVNS